MAKKICLVLTSLSNGGTERFGATLSFILESLGYKVFIFTTHNKTEYEFSGELFSLEAESYKNLGIPGKLVTMYQYFKTHNFDVIIDSRLRTLFLKEWIIHKLFYKKTPYIGMIHNHKVQNYFPINRFWSTFIYHSKTQFVGVSNEITKRVKKDYGYPHIETIYNPISVEQLTKKAFEKIEPLPYQYILFFGRLERDSKNLSLLIKAYFESELHQKNIKLVIMGKGDDYINLKKLTKKLNIEDAVIFKNYRPNPFPYVKDALFTTLTSRYEGFPMSIIESLACGTPVIAVNCKSGPSEVIAHKQNGLLVKNHDSKALAQAFNTYIEDQALQKTCKSNTKQSVADLDISAVTKQWHQLISNM